MRAAYILGAAVPLGLLGGYAWSALPPRSAPYAVPKGVTPKEEPAPETVADREWDARSGAKDGPMLAQSGPDPTAVEQSVHYPNCRAALDAGHAPIFRGQPGYRQELDGDGDGIACEPIRRS